MHNSFLKKYKFANKESMKSFYQLIQIGESENGKNGFFEMLEELNKENSKTAEKINLNFIKDSIKLYMKKYVKINYLLNPEYYPLVRNLINAIEAGKRFDLTLPFLRNISTLPLKRITPLELPSGTKWGQIVIQFIDNESVEISGPKNFREVRSFREMGFENRKKLGRPPTKLWDFLRTLAMKKGTFSWDDLKERTRNPKLIKDAMDNATKRTHLVNQKLKEFFNLKEKPIIYNRKTKTYQTRLASISSEIELF